MGGENNGCVRVYVEKGDKKKVNAKGAGEKATGDGRLDRRSRTRACVQNKEIEKKDAAGEKGVTFIFLVFNLPQTVRVPDPSCF